MDVVACDGGHDSQQAAHEKLRQVREELIRDPAITTVEGEPHGTLHTKLRAEVDPSSIGADAPGGTLTVRWFVGEPDDPPRFTFQYSDESGFDCGWQHHEQGHVDGLGQFQKHDSDAEAYEDTAFQFGSSEPARVTWEILDELKAVLHG